MKTHLFTEITSETILNIGTSICFSAHSPGLHGNIYNFGNGLAYHLVVVVGNGNTFSEMFKVRSYPGKGECAAAVQFAVTAICSAYDAGFENRNLVY